MVVPTPDNARVAPEDKLLYQYVFSHEFGGSERGFFVQKLVQVFSAGGYLTYDFIRHSALYSAAVQLGFSYERERHRDIVFHLIKFEHMPYYEKNSIFSNFSTGTLSDFIRLARVFARAIIRDCCPLEHYQIIFPWLLRFASYSDILLFKRELPGLSEVDIAVAVFSMIFQVIYDVINEFYRPSSVKLPSVLERIPDMVIV